MEETKLIDAESEGVFWQWQSGPSPDPWAERDPAKRIWQDYSDEDCRIIEEAFMLKKEVADLKDYEIDLKKMLQVNKKLRDRIRRVRRQEKSRFMLELSVPVAVVRDQKTMNDAFGTVQQFLNYIMKRTLEAYGLYQRLKSLTLKAKISEFEDIMNEVIACIGKGAEVREKVISTRLGSKKTTFIQDAKIIVNQIRSNSATLEDFLKTILRVYTEETFVCYWLNELLRTENWEEINVLTPYLVCLVYTFKRSEYVLKYQEPEGLRNSFLGLFGKRTLFLYRGTVLSEEHLNIYKRQRIKYFSWNGVTSTSREMNVALKFIEISMSKAQRLKEKKMKVLFKIETDVASPEDREGMIDVSFDSKFPEEREIILAPGTVFELIKMNLIENDVYKINLKVTKKFDDTRTGAAFLGALQDQVISGDKAIIKGFPSQQSFKLLEMLKGNKLIQKLEIRNSRIGDHLIDEIENVIATTNVKKENVKMINNVIKIDSLSSYISSFTGLNDFVMTNEIEFTKEEYSRKEPSEKDKKIKSLVISLETFKVLTRNNQVEDFMKKVERLSELTTLDLSVSRWDREESWILEYLKNTKSLQTLKLRISSAVSGYHLEELCKAIGSSKTINQVSLSFALRNTYKKEIPAAGYELALIGAGRNLSLDLWLSCDTPAEELIRLRFSFEALKSLQSFSLRLIWYYESVNEKLYHLKSDPISLTSLASLESLAFDFNSTSGSKTSNEDLNNLKNSLISLKSLQRLSIAIEWGWEISDEGIKHLKNGFTQLTSLKDLYLNFKYCGNVSGEEISHLISSNLTSLERFSLTFTRISNKGLNLLSQSLTSLISLQHLSLSFIDCIELSDEGVQHLSKSLASLKPLQHLALNFNVCNKISNMGINHLSKSLMSHTSLQYLSFNFSGCKEISDKGLNHLNSTLVSLTSLQGLYLEFSSCPQISDKGLVFSFRPSLQRLSLCFGACPNVSDQGLDHLKSTLRSLTSLEYLNLFFPKCNITDKGLNHLKDGLVSLTFLQDFSLELWDCPKIADESLNHLSKSLMSLKSLQRLSINLKDNDGISGKGLDYLKKSLPFSGVSII